MQNTARRIGLSKGLGKFERGGCTARRIGAASSSYSPRAAGTARAGTQEASLAFYLPVPGCAHGERMDPLPADLGGAGAWSLRFGGNNEYTLGLAMNGEDCLKCWRLVYREYLAHGYTSEEKLECRYSIHDALPGTGTFLAEKDGRPVATVTVFPDSPLGLPADESYREELGFLRARGRRPAETGRLTIGREYVNDRHLLAALFDNMALYARFVLDATDLVITVNPAHVKFYETMLLFERIGGEKDLGSVCGAPAVLLGLDWEVEMQARRWAHGEGPKPRRVNGRRTFYPYLSSVAEGEKRMARLMEQAKAPDAEFLDRYFVRLNPLLPGLPAPLRRFFETCYPEHPISTPAER